MHVLDIYASAPPPPPGVIRYVEEITYAPPPPIHGSIDTVADTSIFFIENEADFKLINIKNVFNK